jgi:hypothetical protein
LQAGGESVCCGAVRRRAARLGGAGGEGRVQGRREGHSSQNSTRKRGQNPAGHGSWDTDRGDKSMKKE